MFFFGREDNKNGVKMNKLNKLVAVLLVAILSIGLVACGSKNGNNIQGNNPGNTQTPASSTPEATANATSTPEAKVSYPVTITDSFGKTITLDKEPQKIISVAPNVTEMLYKLGVEDKLVGRTDYCDYPAEVSKVESIGTLNSPDIEKIISLEPDVVITSTHFDEANTAKLEAAGIQVIGLYEENQVTGVYTMIEILGTAVNKEAEAAQTVEEMKATVDEVTEKVKGLEQPSVYYVVSYGESDYSAPDNTFIGQMIKMAGGSNIVPASDSWAYSLEALIEADPDIIVIRKGEKEAFCSSAAYKELTAVKEGKVYEIDNNLLDRQGYRNAEGLKELATIFHPEAFK